jgi:hypothetical protein
MHTTEHNDLFDFLEEMEKHYILKPRQNGQPVDKQDLWSWLHASLAARSLETLERISGQLTDLSDDLDGLLIEPGTLKKLAADVQQIKLNTAPD